MELKDLVGKHQLSGVDYADGDYMKDIGISIMFCLDGITYIAVEDPDDGYRSYMREIVVSDIPCKNVFNGEEVFCEHEIGKYADDDILYIKNPLTAETILKIGTEDVTDFYPCCVMEYHPENLQCNKGR